MIDVDRFILHLNGEPLIDSRLFERIAQLRYVFPSAGIFFTTNFALADDSKIDAIVKSGVDQITVSINSLDNAEYRELMGLDLNHTLNNIEKLLKKREQERSKLRIRISVVARSDNKEMVDRIKTRYKNIADVRCITLGDWIGDSRERDKEPVTKVECDDLFRQICFLSNGDMSLCCFDAEGIIGKNIKDIGILEGFSSKVYSDVRQMQILKGREGFCRKCSFS